MVIAAKPTIAQTIGSAWWSGWLLHTRRLALHLVTHRL
jgi:hypothetical protein